ncbi:MAG: enoyl-CoA hydratase family protein [Planctomycetes bacterium]|nr:enoyl-CoA hydratase family protein [Planctomycetota bacterium]
MTDTTFDFRFDIGDDGVAVLTLDRPERLNALTFAIYGQLERLFADLETDPRVRAIVITGAGRGFCSGGDVDDIIGALLNAAPHQTLAFTRMTGAVVRNMLRLSKPIVAAIHGVAAGAGAVIALASDLRVMTRDASFAFLFTRVGLTGADMGAAWLLPRMIGHGRAAELLLLGDKIGAEDCHRVGLASRLVDPGAALDTALELARRFARGPGLALGMTKRLLVNEWPMDLDAAIEQEAQAQALLLRCHDHREFHTAWSERREPRFEGR